MSITVRVIFWGLMGFVPNQEGQSGLTALLVKPRHHEAEPHRSPKHVPIVYLYEGRCDGEACTREIPADFKEHVAIRLGATTPGLRWLLADEDLEIFGDEDEIKFNNTGRKTFFRNLREAPRRARQTADFSWVPSMDVLTGGHGRVRDDCLYWVGTCPLSARFKVRGGEARTCHLFHGPETGKVVIFSYKSVDGKPENVPPPQAVADAVQVEFEVEGDYVELRSWDFPTVSAQQTLKVAVKLRPTAGRKTVTLIVSNGPRHSDDEPKYEGPPHQEALLSLLAREPVSRFTREESSSVRVNPGICEREIAALAQAEFERPNGKHAKFDPSEDRRRREVPHSTTACDGASYP